MSFATLCASRGVRVYTNNLFFVIKSAIWRIYIETHYVMAALNRRSCYSDGTSKYIYIDCIAGHP